LNQQTYRNLISAKSTNPVVVLLRFFLNIAAKGYSLVITLRNLLYTKSWFKIHTVDVPVISIGNITTGGTGKTPLVIWLCKLLQKKQVCCAVLTRGYKATQNHMDEPAILAENCPQTKVIVNPDRVEGAAESVNKHGAKVLIMDDGFQHRRLQRDLDIVTIDATCPFGYGKLLPAGLLREPVASLKRADAVVLTKCDQISESELSRIEKKLQPINPGMIISKSIHNPIFVKSADGEEITIEQLKNKKIFAFCGIGNPDAFLNSIKNIGANLVGSKIYNDHHQYNNSDIDFIQGQANHSGADLILSTQKDWTRTTLLTPAQKGTPFAYLAVEIKFIAGEDILKQLIEDTLAGKILKTKEY
jgi:tetraacyldisaccharide 4'-kinase